MNSLRNWWLRLGALISTVALTVLVPAAAWAATGPGELVVEAARRRRGVGGFFGLICCLVVIAIIVILLAIVMRGRRSGRR